MTLAPTPSTLRLAALLLLALGVAFTSGCKSRRDKDIPQTAPAQVYESAQKSLDEGDYNNAIRLYEALYSRFPFTAEGRQSRLDVMYAYYKARESESALDAAETFIRENPTHPRVDYAWYIRGLVDFERVPNFFEKMFRADLNQRPPQTARKSFAAFRKVAEDYPRSLYAHDARKRMIYLRNRLADYELNVARYYIKRGAWVAAAQRAKLCIEQYDGAPAIREAMEILIASYERLGMDTLAEQARAVYQVNYGGADGAQPAEVVKRRWWNPFD
jgi:outer membrane protein assembly factor BamD